MENEFDYMNETENPSEQSPVVQPMEEQTPQQPESPYGDNPYS